jgi:hypothetical protein
VRERGAIVTARRDVELNAPKLRGSAMGGLGASAILAIAACGGSTVRTVGASDGGAREQGGSGGANAVQVAGAAGVSQAGAAGLSGSGGCPPWDSLGVEEPCHEQVLFPPADGQGGAVSDPCRFPIAFDLDNPTLTAVALDCVPVVYASANGSWYYEDPFYPTVVVLGEDLCSRLRANEFARVDLVGSCYFPPPP